jgi:hypothetical protein
MRTARIVTILALGAFVWARPAAQETVDVFQGDTLERFLAESEVVRMRELGEGITRPWRVTLAREGVRHDAVFKTVDMPLEPGGRRMADGTLLPFFRDTYQTEVAAYVIDRLIGLGMVPATVERSIQGKRGSLMWWLDAIDESERKAQNLIPPDLEAWTEDLLKEHLFDNLIYNFDRNEGNVLITSDFQIRLIDHSRSMLPLDELPSPEKLTRFSRSLLEGLERLEFDDLKTRIGHYLVDGEIRSLLARRDAILELARERVAQVGETAALYK